MLYIRSRSQTLTDKEQPKRPSTFQAWEGSSVFVNQGKHWASTFIWLSASLFGFSLLWAFTAKVDQTISVRGTLNPEEPIRVVEAPSSGVVSDVYVSDGQSITSGTELVSLESDSISSRHRAIQDTISLVLFETQTLSIILKSDSSLSASNEISNLPISSSDSTLASRLLTARDQSFQIIAQLSQLSNRLSSKKESLRLQTTIAQDVKPLYESGGLARNTYFNQLNTLQELRSEILSLQDEKSRILGAASTRLNSLNKQLINLQSELVRSSETLRNQTVRSPINGKIFDLKVSPSSVVGNQEVLLKVVPSGPLSASLKIPNSDIGFVKVGQKVSIAVDSFPSGEFGYIAGTLERIGSDALPPDSLSPIVYFPALVTFDSQQVVSGDNILNLQSGMSITANIKLRARPAISILTDIFTRQLDGVKTFR